MYQTLFTIPYSIGGIDVFGFGWLLALWAVASVVILARSYRAHGWGKETTGQLPMLVVVGLMIAFVLPQLIDPTMGGLPIRGYGVFLLAAVVGGIGLGIYRARRIGLDPEICLSLATWFFVSGIVGARLFYIIEYWPKFQKPSLLETLGAMINLTQGGLVVYGSLLAGGVAMIVFIYRNKLPGLAFADFVAPSVVLGVGLGRIGCFLNGCCYGGISDIPWAMRFPAGSPAYIDQVERGQLYVHGLIFKGSGDDPPVIEHVEPGSPAEREGLKPGQVVTSIGGQRVRSVDDAQRALFLTFGAAQQVVVTVEGDRQLKVWAIPAELPRSRPVHPTQLYSLIDALLLCAFILAYEPYKRRDGELTALVLTIHPISRFLLEIIRVDESAVFNTGMSISQNISIGIFIFGVCLWMYLLWSRPRQSVWPAQLAVG